MKKIDVIVAAVFSAILLICCTIWAVKSPSVENIVGAVFGAVGLGLSLWGIFSKENEE